MAIPYRSPCRSGGDAHPRRPALERLEIDWEPLPHVVDAVAALAPGAPRLHADIADNRLVASTVTGGDPGARCAEAAVTVTGTFRINNDYTGELLAIAEFNEATESVKLAEDRRLRTLPFSSPWHHGMYVMHRFRHPQYAVNVSRHSAKTLGLRR